MAKILRNLHDGSHTESITLDCPHCRSTIRFEYGDWVTDWHHSHEQEAQKGYLGNYVRCPACSRALVFGSALLGHRVPRSWEKRLAREESGH